METTEQTAQENTPAQMQANPEGNTLAPSPTGMTLPAPPLAPAILEAAARAAAEAGPETIKAAVLASHAAPAPNSAENQQLQHHEGLLNTLLDKVHEFALFMENAAPLLALVEQASQDRAEAVSGASGHLGAVTARVGALEGFAAELVGMLGSHFSNKLPLPTPPVA